MDDVLKDKRFKHIARDPRFRRMKRKDRKVKIDKRFQGMFSNKEFKLKYTVDKRGRPVQSSTNENLQKYYELNSSDESEEEDDDSSKNVKKKDKITDNNNTKSDIMKEASSDSEEGSASEESEEEPVEKSPAKSDPHATNKGADEVEKDSDNDESDDDDDDDDEDFARGQGNVETSSSEEEEDEEDDEVDHKWGELARDAPLVSDATSRLALCNMDWDRIKASDIYVLINSFKPVAGTIHSVTVYPSEYGLERMKEEDQKGPIELVEQKQEEEDEVAQRERLREYQLKRLRYYYAVIACDSPETANHIYTECDGLEYESSSNKIDLRFIPEDMIFEQEPKSQVSHMPDASAYKPTLYTNSALMQSKVQLTWDETDKDRVATTMRRFKEDELAEMDVKAYLASSDSEGEGDDPYAGFEDPDFGSVDDGKASNADTLKELVQEEEQGKKEAAGLEITWEAGIKSNDIEMRKKKKVPTATLR